MLYLCNKFIIKPIQLIFNWRVIDAISCIYLGLVDIVEVIQAHLSVPLDPRYFFSLGNQQESGLGLHSQITPMFDVLKSCI